MLVFPVVSNLVLGRTRSSLSEVGCLSHGTLRCKSIYMEFPSYHVQTPRRPLQKALALPCLSGILNLAAQIPWVSIYRYIFYILGIIIYIHIPKCNICCVVLNTLQRSILGSRVTTESSNVYAFAPGVVAPP